ncbi:MAG: hypothetical protein ACP5T0_04905 [Verrucomicrobiia bacterium]
MNRWKNIVLVCGILLCLIGVWQSQKFIDEERKKIELPNAADLQNAPPMLRFTTIALGGFRGIIANILWIRASDLQDQDKYFEMVQLADWITKLQPRLKQVWLMQAWNMTYNISIKFTDPEDRWRWVMRGVELLRDDALRYCPDEPLIYRELAWFYQHKIGQSLDDAHQFYKKFWFQEMNRLLDGKENGYLDLIDPQTQEQKSRAEILRKKYKMDPNVMKEIDARFGPLEWRLPEATAIYWAYVGLKKAKDEDKIVLRRVIYQSMLLAFQRGRLIFSKADDVPLYGPNLDIIPKVNDAYETMMSEEKDKIDTIKRAHRNFLRQAVFQLYAHARVKEAKKWFDYLKEKYPDDVQVKEANGDLDTFAIKRVTEGVKDLDINMVKSFIQGFLRYSYIYLVYDDEQRANGYFLLARKLYDSYQSRLVPGQKERVSLPPFDELNKATLSDALDPQNGFEPRMRAILRTKLNLPPEQPASQSAIESKSQTEKK